MGVKLNGTDLSDLGIGMTSIRGWANSPDVSRGTFQTGGPFGQIPAGVEEVGARGVSVEGLIKGNTIATRIAVWEAALAQCRGMTEITPDDHPDRVVVGQLIGDARVRGVTDLLTMLRDVIRVRLDFVCHDPNYRDIPATIVAFDSTARSVPMGDQAHKWDMVLTGTTDPVVTIRDFRGVSVHTMGLTVTHAADEYSRLDGYQHRVYLGDSGVETRAPAALTSGAFKAFDPAWADHVSGASPTIEVDSGTGVLTYWRRWRT